MFAWKSEIKETAWTADSTQPSALALLLALLN